MPKKSSPKSSPKPKSVKRRVVTKSKKSNKSTREIERQRLIDGAKVCVRAVDGAFPKDPTRIENVLAFLKEDKKVMGR